MPSSTSAHLASSFCTASTGDDIQFASLHGSICKFRFRVIASTIAHSHLCLHGNRLASNSQSLWRNFMSFLPRMLSRISQQQSNLPFLPTCLEKRLQFLMSSLFPSIILNTRCAHDHPIGDDSSPRNCLGERIACMHRLVDRRLK